MGNCCSQTAPTSIFHARHKSQISKELQQDAQTDKRKHKLLILGPKRSGKSTVLNQLKFLHGGGFIPSERAQSKIDIALYIIEAIKNIIECVEQYEIHKLFPIHRFTLNNDAHRSVQYIKSLSPNQNIITDTIAHHICLLSQQTPIQKIINNADKYYIDISIHYFLTHLDRIKNINYIPTDQDIIQLRLKTDAFNEEEIEIRNYIFEVYDIDYKPDICNVNKYMHCFENVTAIIFVASLCAFDEPIFEDNKTWQERMEWKQSLELMESVVGNDILNIVLEFIGFVRNTMQQSLDLFDSLCNNIWFEQVPIVLFLSKSDLFADKISDYHNVHSNDTRFMEVFPEYTNKMQYWECSEFIKQKFETLNASQNRQVITHCVNGTDMTLMTKMFNDVQTFIINASLSRGGLI